jgi:hypothetical protein
MQNTIVKEFEGNPDVVAVVFNQGGDAGETREWLEIFWNNYYLRGSVLWDENGYAAGNYTMPNTGNPFGRGFIIDQDGLVSLPYFGREGMTVIRHIYQLLGGVPPQAPEGVEAEADGMGNLVLTWSPVTHDVTGLPITVERYEAYRSTLAYFSVVGLEPVAVTTTTEFTDIDATGEPSVNYYYRIVAVSTSNIPSDPSDIVGEFDFEGDIP